MNSNKYLFNCKLVFFVIFIVVFIIHIDCINGKKKSIYENHEAKLDSLLLTFHHKPVGIDSFFVDDVNIENSNAKEFLEKLNENNKSQFNELINEVNKNSLQFSKITTDAENRLSRELNNLNLWVTIWIGLFAVFSIGTHYFTKKEIEKEIQEFREKSISLTNKIDSNNAQLEIFTILSILRELSGQPVTFFDNIGRYEIIKDLLLGAASKMKSIFQNEVFLFDRKTNQYDYTFKFLFIEISITMRQIQLYCDKREIIEIIEKIYKLSDDIKDKINEPNHSNFKKELNDLLLLFDSLPGLFTINYPAFSQ